MPDKVLITKSKLDSLANAISAKTGEPLPLTIAEMEDAVEGLSGGGIVISDTTDAAGGTIRTITATDTTTLISKTVTQNGTYDPADDNADGYSEVIVDVSGGGGGSTLITKTISANGVYDAEDDNADGYSEVTVNVSAPAPNLQAKTNISPTASSQTIQADSGYDGLSSVQINAIPTGTATAPASISGTSATVSTGTNTLTLTKTVSVTPSVTAGYVSSGTAGNSSVSLTANVATKGSTVYGAVSSDVTIASGTYLTGLLTIKAVRVSGLSADTILSGTTVKVGDEIDDDRITSITGNVVIQHYYTGSSAPSSSTGVNGDIYLKTS